jgi:hypothetical protein
MLIGCFERITGIVTVGNLNLGLKIHVICMSAAYGIPQHNPKLMKKI